MDAEVVCKVLSGEGDCSKSELEGDFAENSQDIKHSDGSKKRENHQHHRRKPSKKKRKWKPYSKMTWEEKKAVEEREKIRAHRIRGEMMDRGRPVAPYNTTQFIMAEHDPYEEDSVLEAASNAYHGRSNEKASNDAESSKSSTSGAYSAALPAGDSPSNLDDVIEAEYNDSPHMAPEFISQDFSEAYERVQEESLSTMSRNDLVQEHISLERTLSYLQDKLAREKSINNSYSLRVESFEEELEVLRKENRKLVRENVCLRYGDGAMTQQDGNGTYQASDYEYEAPNSDSEIAEYAEQSNDDEDFQQEDEDNVIDQVSCEREYKYSYESDSESPQGISLASSPKENISVEDNAMVEEQDISDEEMHEKASSVKMSEGVKQQGGDTFPMNKNTSDAYLPGACDQNETLKNRIYRQPKEEAATVDTGCASPIATLKSIKDDGDGLKGSCGKAADSNSNNNVSEEEQRRKSTLWDNPSPLPSNGNELSSRNLNESMTAGSCLSEVKEAPMEVSSSAEVQN